MRETRIGPKNLPSPRVDPRVEETSNLQWPHTPIGGWQGRWMRVTRRKKWKIEQPKEKVIIKSDWDVPFDGGLLRWADDNKDLDFTTRVSLYDKLGGLMLPVRPSSVKQRRSR